MLRSVAPSLLTWLALISVLIVVVEATGPVPGLRWDRLQVWEGSAAHDAWSRVDEYVAFRSYVLGCLGDLGFLDVLIADFTTETLREIDGFGLATGFAVAISTAEVVRRRRAPRSRQAGRLAATATKKSKPTKSTRRS